MRLRLRKLTAGRVAFSAWALPGGGCATVRMGEREKLTADAAGYGPYAPAAGARFLLAACVPALDTPDGWPARGDCWEVVDSDTGRAELHAATAPDPDWSCAGSIAEPPAGLHSLADAWSGGAAGNRLVLPADDLPAVRRGGARVRVPRPRAFWRQARLLIPNHRSSTYDASNSGKVNGGGSSITVSVTVASQSNRYLAGCSASRVGQSLSSVAYGGTGLTSRLNVTSPSTARCQYYDLVAPASGTANLVFTYSANTDAAAGGISAYGVDQASPRSNTASANHDETGTGTGQGTNPRVAGMSSASGELVLGYAAWDTSGSLGSPALTIDGAWTSLWNLDSASGGGSNVNSRGGGAAYLAGAASVTRSDTLSPGSQWAMVLVSLAAAKGAPPPFHRSARFMRRASGLLVPATSILLGTATSRLKRAG